MFAGVEKESLAEIVRDLLYADTYRNSDEVKRILTDLSSQDEDESAPEGTVVVRFLPRGRTGRRAEELFLNWFHEGALPFSGSLSDRREDGCGYDFHINDGGAELLVEVKGLAELEGEVALTDKEWFTARNTPNYWLFVVYSVHSDTPQWKIIENITSLSPRRSVRTTVQVSWHLIIEHLAD
jgi:hypothetical protein